MKKVILFVFALGLFANVNAQKKSNSEVKLAKNVSAIAEEMDLNKDKETFLYNTLLEEKKHRMSQIKGKELSKEEKKVIVKAAKKDTTKKLKAQFSSEEIKQVYALIKEQYQKSKK
jgi:hypothetical protein